VGRARRESGDGDGRALSAIGRCRAGAVLRQNSFSLKSQRFRKLLASPVAAKIPSHSLMQFSRTDDGGGRGDDGASARPR
jgi:hypothetical protein